MDDDVPDYMSDEFITEKYAEPSHLVTARSIQRKRIAERLSKMHPSLSKTEEEAQKRTEGLEKKVGPENKGFGLLLKMGYTPGKGLGKNSTGIPEPVPIEMPAQRAGVGLVTARKEKVALIKQIKNNQLLAAHNRFRDGMAEKFHYSRIQRQLRAAQNICFQLDTEHSFTSPICPSFWPPQPDDQLSTDSTVSNKHTLSNSTHHSSRSHGCRKMRRLERLVCQSDDGEDDLQQKGCDLTENNFPELSDDEDLTSLDANKLPAENFEEILEKIIAYLRGEHFYCFWCSAQYDSRTDLLSQCPGPTEADHD